MSEGTYEAANLESALAQAAKSMGANPGDLQYEVIEERTDFWGVEEDKVVIKVWRPEQEAQEASPVDDDAESPPDPAEAEAAAKEAVAEPEAPAPVEAERSEPAKPAAGGFWGDDDDAKRTEESEAAESDAADDEDHTAAADHQSAPADEVVASSEEDSAPEPAAAPASEQGEVEPDDILALLQQIFHDMDFDCAVDIERQEDGFLAGVGGADKDLLLEGNGSCLSALELILNNAFRHRLPAGNKVRVDAGDFRSRREEELTDLAFQVAHSAKEAGRTQETQPLNPYERRLVHLALAEDPGVTTRSRGSGFLKNVQIIPRRRGGGGRRRKN